MHLTRLKRQLDRQVQRQQRQLENLNQSAEAGLDRNLFRRFKRLMPVRRFLIVWLSVCALLGAGLVYQISHLSSYYQQQRPINGGIYTEGMQGTISNVNPIFASSDAEHNLSRLLFAGLMTYDTHNQLVGDLARSYHVSDDGKTYTVILKPHLTWQDGRPLTAQDVLFTYQTIKNPDAQSPLLSSWQNVAVSAPNSTTIEFKLKSPLASFPYSLTTGIIPKHRLEKVAARDLRADSFNTQPIGAGPFSWHGLAVSGTSVSALQEQVALLPFSHYVGGRPKVSEFIVRAYASQTALIAALQSKQLTAASGLDNLPANLSKNIQQQSTLLTAGTYVFFKNSTGVLADQSVRQALVAAAQPNMIQKDLGYDTKSVTEPVLSGQFAYNPQYAQQTNNLQQGQTLLDQAGWLVASNGIRSKNGAPLHFTVVAVDTPEYRQVASQLKQQWKALGAQADIQFESAADYNVTLSGHQYDATIYGISIGTDPDVFAYWDSSQADPRSPNRLNLSEWKNPTADSALEAGRSRLDPQIRAIKYRPFLLAWQQQAPALGLYQPRSLYLTSGTVYGLNKNTMNSTTDRYDNVQNWQIRSARVTD